ncbi:unnamed protein product, partial [marine sediment metagenome]
MFGTTNYTTSIIPNIVSGNYLINLFTDNLFHQNYTSVLNVNILHQFQLQSVEDEYSTFYSNDLITKYTLVDLSNNSVPVSPDDYWVSIEGLQIVENDGFVFDFINNQIIITIDIAELGYSVGLYELELNVEKVNFVEIIGTNQTSTSITFSIVPIETEVIVESSVSEIEINSQVTLSFRILDQNHSSYVEEATVEVSLDIPEPEV